MATDPIRTPMPHATTPDERLAQVELRLERLEHLIDDPRAAPRAAHPQAAGVPFGPAAGRPRPPAEAAPAWPLAEPVPPARTAPAWAPSGAAAWPSQVAPARAAAPAPPRRTAMSEEALGSRVLAWGGGVALLGALATLVWLGVDRGWIGEGLRCALAALASGLLLAVGLRAGRGTTPLGTVPQALSGAGLAGLYLSSAVATAGYGLLPVGVGAVLLLLVAAASVGLALRREAPGLAGLGLLGASGVPLLGALADRPLGGPGLAALALLLAGTVVILRRRPWSWLAPAAILLALPQGLILAALQAPEGTFLGSGTDQAWLASWAVVIGLASGELALAMARTARSAEVRGAAIGLLGLVALVVLPVVAAAQGPSTLPALLGALALAAALAARLAVMRRTGTGEAASPAELVVGALALVALDVAIAVQAAGDPWITAVVLAGAAVPLALVAAGRAPRTAVALRALAAAELALAAVAVPAAGGPRSVEVVVAVLALLGAAVLAARLSRGAPGWRTGFDGGAILVAAGWSAAALPVEAVVVSWALAGVLLALRARSVDDLAALVAAPALSGLAVAAAFRGLDGLPLHHLVTGMPAGTASAVPFVLAAVVGAVAVAVLLPAATVLPPAVRVVATALAGFAAISLAVATAARLAGGSPDAVAVAVDVAWGAIGVVGLALGLARDVRAVRVAGLVVLGATVLKVAFVDLAAVDVLWRVAAWAGLAVALLGGAALYARGEARRTAGARPGD